MRKHVIKMYIVVAVAAILWGTTGLAAEIVLNWKNGDVLRGQLLESEAGTIRWSSPYFLDDLLLDVKVLDSVVFRSPDAAPVGRNGQMLTTEPFRVRTLSGDVWIADLIGSDDDTFLFSSKRHGQFRVKRAAVYMLERRERPDFLFDGSQLKYWKLPEAKREAVDPALPFDFVRRSDWFADSEGHPKTWIDNAEIFYAFNWPEHFEIELEFASDTYAPNFSFALGKDRYQTSRLEVWEDELVAVQGVLFKSVLKIQPEQRSLRLRLTYHEGSGVLRVFDATGNLLLNLEGVKPTVKEPGLYIQNRGEDLTVRNVKVYRQLKEPAAQRINLSKPHVYMTSGEKIQGRLFVEGEGAYVLDTDGTRRDINFQELNHIVQPGIPSAGLAPMVTLKYPDKVVLHGELMRVESERVVLQTAFADAPVTCSLSDALRLQIAANPDGNETAEDMDTLFCASDRLHGRVVFGGGQGRSAVQWASVGALKPVRLADDRASHIERSDPSAIMGAKSPNPYAQFRHTLHLKSGESFPGHIAAYDGTSVSFRSPFISAQHLDAVDIKALEFSGRTHAPRTDRTQPKNNFDSLKVTMADKGNGIKEVNVRLVAVGKDGKEVAVNVNNVNNIKEAMVLNEMELMGNPEPAWAEVVPNIEFFVARSSSTVLPVPKKDKSHQKLERALTVPRFSRDHPPSHILVAKTGDLKRGKFLDFRGQAIRFDSKLREFSVPIDRVARVVSVSKRRSQASVVRHRLKNDLVKSETSLVENRKLETDDSFQSEIRVTLADGSMLIFEPLEVRDGELVGRSSIYGAVSVPLNSIQDLYFGEKAKVFRAAFEKWTVRPAEEPMYDESR